MGRIGRIARRTFLIGTAAIAGGVAFGYYMYRRDPGNPLKPGAGEATLNPYILIDQDGVTVVTPRAEMGQGVQSTLAALVAEELDLDWAAVRIMHGPPATAYYNAVAMGAALPFKEYERSAIAETLKGGVSAFSKFVSLQITGGSSSTVDAFDKMRRAGAAARITLVEAAARRLGVSASALKTENGNVVAPDGQTLSYPSLAEAAAAIEPPSDPPLRDPSQWRYLGKDMPRLDMTAKVTGAARFGTDVALPDLLYASVRMNPHLGAAMNSYDAAKAEAMPGVEKVVDLGGGVGVLATNTWIAMRALDEIAFEWAEAPYPASTKDHFEALAATFDDGANSTLRDDGDVDGALADADEVIEAEYRLPFLAHTAMEPMSATARLKDGRLEIWAGTQIPYAVRKKAAEVAGIDEEAVTLHTTFMGGSFGRRLEADFTNQAVRLAMAAGGRPVRMTWTREEDMAHDFYRPAALARCRGAMGADGPIAFKADIASPSVTRQQGLRLLGLPMAGPDKVLVEGCFDQPYGIANYQVNGYLSDLAVPVGSWRSVGNSYNAFIHECFLDELAASKGLDPLAMRLGLMVDDWSRKTLEAVAEMAGWTGTTPDGFGRGIAFTHSFGTPAAVIVEVRRSDRGIRIEKAWCAVDVGQALDRRNIEAQIMSGLIYGLSAAMFGGITFENGRVVQSNFHDQDALRMMNAPAIEARVLENKPHMSGIGEPATPPSMPALANAVFDLTGERRRDLPLGDTVAFVS